MRTPPGSLEATSELLVKQAHQFLEVVRDLDDLALLGPSLCRGWSRLELIVHVRMGLDEMATAVQPDPSLPVSHDYVTYWSSYADNPDEDPIPGLMWLRRTASAYERPSSSMEHLADAVDRACMTVKSLNDQPVMFQGKTLMAADFVTTWIVELVMHLLDLDIDASPIGSHLGRRTVEALAGRDLPSSVTDDHALLIGFGREQLPEDIERSQFFPVWL